MQLTQLFPWFALRVRSRGELATATLLNSKGFTTYTPTFREARQYADRIKKLDSALFPGYTFCRLNPERYLPVIQTAGVHSIICIDGRPAPVDDTEITAIQQVLSTGAAAIPWPFLKPGHKVKICFGSFAGVEGIVVQEKGRDRLVLSVSLLQRAIAVEMDRSWIQPAA